ncbi:hypothetical protein X777_03684 [Ooceraea biroi]|uniref:Uncharacterized protein n=1 Tax=Ooceraea biroi TaxID=2015173 RepID=A0A026WLM2_OOCBI|nr:hypothetical protein X777_03684 [Ooceraea biroi]
MHRTEKKKSDIADQLTGGEKNEEGRKVGTVEERREGVAGTQYPEQTHSTV